MALSRDNSGRSSVVTPPTGRDPAPETPAQPTAGPTGVQLTGNLAQELRSGAGSPQTPSGTSPQSTTQVRPADLTYQAQQQAAPEYNSVMAQCYNLLPGHRKTGRLAVDGYIDPVKTADTIYYHAIYHDVHAADLDPVRALRDDPDAWNQFEQELREKTQMSGSAVEILRALNVNQMEFKEKKYPGTTPFNLNYMIDEASPQRLEARPTGEILTYELHKPGSARDNYNDFVNGALAVTSDDRPRVREQMSQLTVVVSGATSVLNRELDPKAKAPNISTIIDALSGLDKRSIELIEERYDEIHPQAKLRDRLREVTNEANEPSIDLLSHMLDNGFDALWTARELGRIVDNSGDKPEDWKPSEQQRSQMRALLSRLTESQMDQVSQAISNPVARDVFAKFTNPDERDSALALLASNGNPNAAQNITEYPAGALQVLRRSLNDGDFIRLRQVLEPLNGAQRKKLFQDYSGEQASLDLPTIRARLTTGESQAELAEDPILHPPIKRRNVLPNEVESHFRVKPDDIEALWQSIETLTAEREREVRHNRPFTKQKPAKSFSKWTDDDYDAVVRLARSLGPNGIPPADLLAIFQIECSGDATKVNRKSTTLAAGLFQLTRDNQKRLGYKPGEVERMSVADQINEIGPVYFSQHQGSRILTGDDAYASIFIGSIVRGDQTNLYHSGSIAYEGNKRYDHDGDGKIQLGEALTDFRLAQRTMNNDTQIMLRLRAAERRLASGQMAANNR